MSDSQPAELQLVAIHIPQGEHRGIFGRLTYEEIVLRLLKEGTPGITVFRGYEGLDAHGQVQTLNAEYTQDSFPLVMEVVGSSREIPMQTIQNLLKGHPHCVTITPAINAKVCDTKAEERKCMTETMILKIYMKEADRYRNMPLYHALVLEAKKRRFHWVNVQRALEGFGPDRVVRRENVFKPFAHAPVLVELIGSKEDVLNFKASHKSMICNASGPAVLVQGHLVSETT